MLDPRLVARIDALEPISIETQAYRHLAVGRNPLSGSGARVSGGRWNPPDSFATLYVALDRETAIAELQRLAARQRRSLDDFLPRRIYRYSVSLVAVLDLRTQTQRESVELGESELRADDPVVCRQVAEAAQHLGLEAVLAPSATGSGTVLAVFFDRLRADSHVRDLDYESWTPPAA